MPNDERNIWGDEEMTVRTRVSQEDIKSASVSYHQRMREAYEALKNYLAKLDKIIPPHLHPLMRRSLEQSLKDKDGFTIELHDYIGDFLSADEKEIFSRYRLLFLNLMAFIDSKPLEHVSMETDRSGVITWFKNKVEEWYLEGELSETTVELTLGHEKLEELEFKKHLRKKYARK